MYLFSFEALKGHNVVHLLLCILKILKLMSYVTSKCLYQHRIPRSHVELKLQKPSLAKGGTTLVAQSVE